MIYFKKKLVLSVQMLLNSKSTPKSTNMKKQSLLILSVLFMLALSFSACQTGKKVAKVEKQDKLILPFSSNSYQSDQKYFRFVQSHESTDLSLAKTRAIMKAQVGLASSVEALLKSVMDNYTSERKLSQSEVNDSYKEISRLVVYRNLRHTKIIGEEAYLDKADKKYTYWVAIEVSAQDVYSEAVKGISASEKLRQDFDESRFRKEFDEEMRKKELEQNNLQFDASK